MTCDACVLPQEITVGYSPCLAREYILTRQRCYKCNWFGHGSISCREESSHCAKFGEEKHGERWDETVKFSNCTEQHPTFFKDCFFSKLKKESRMLQTREKFSYAEAKHGATDELVNSRGSYADVVSSMLHYKWPLKATNLYFIPIIISGYTFSSGYNLL